MVDEDLEDRFDTAAEVVDEIFSGLSWQLGGRLAEVGSLSYTRLLIAFHPGVGTVLTEGGGVYYVVDEKMAGFLGGAAQDIPEAADVVREICASNVFEGQPLPYHLRAIAFQLIKGTHRSAKRRGPKLDQDFLQRWLLRDAAIYLSDAYSLELTRYDGPRQMSACDVVSLVAKRHGFDVSFTRLRDWCSHADHREMRRRADALSNYFKDLQLIEWGALSARPLYGPFAELARMRG